MTPVSPTGAPPADPPRGTALARRLLATAVVLAVLVAADVAAEGRRRLFDLTAERSLSLSDATLEILAGLDTDIEITAFVRRSGAGWVEAHNLLRRYERENPRITGRVLDPDDAPGEARRLGVDPLFGGVAVRAGEEIEVGETVTEQDITAAIARLLRGTLPTVCLSAGHGELDPGSTLPNGFAEAAGLLADNGYTVRRVDLVGSGARSSPAALTGSCAALVVAAPTVPLTPGAVGAVDRYLDADGRLLVLAEPGFPTGLEDRLGAEGIHLLDGVVVERDPAARFEDDPTTIIVRRFSAAHPVVAGVPAVVLVGAGGVDTDDRPPSGLVVSRLADSSPSSYLERDPRRLEPDDADVPGPVTVAAASDRSRTDGRTIHRTRTVVIADGDGFTNVALDALANSRLLVRAVDWLTVDENLVAVTVNLARPRPLELTEARRRYALQLTGIIIPGLILIAGAMVWAVRRSR